MSSHTTSMASYFFGFVQPSVRPSIHPSDRFVSWCVGCWSGRRRDETRRTDGRTDGQPAICHLTIITFGYFSSIHNVKARVLDSMEVFDASSVPAVAKVSVDAGASGGRAVWAGIRAFGRQRRFTVTVVCDVSGVLDLSITHSLNHSVNYLVKFSQ